MRLRTAILEEIASRMLESRNFYVGLGWRKDDCSIGYFDGMLKLASDTGASWYRDRGDGLIIRDSGGFRSKLIEFVETEVQAYIDAHNQGVKDRILLEAR